MQGPLFMNDLYSLSQLIKAHPLYSVQRDEIHHLYLDLANRDRLNPENLMSELKGLWPDLFLSLQKNHQLFKVHCQETLRLSKQGVHFVCYGESTYPSSFYWMTDPPLTLSFLGAASWINYKTLASVGSREPSIESAQWMEKEFAPFCELANPCIVSGGARGIDQKSHGIALRKGCATVVVLPSGLGVMYPEALKEWISPVLDKGGCFVSEYAFEQRMHKHLFHHRNRLIAAFGQGTLMVEARKRSGTLITAQQTVSLGRPVWVVPGHPLDPHFGGSLELLSDGAQVVRDAQDLFLFFNSEVGQGQFATRTYSEGCGDVALPVVSGLSYQNPLEKNEMK